MTPAAQLNPGYFTPEREERIRRTSPRTFNMHVLNLFGGAENSLLTKNELDRCIQRDLPPGYVRKPGELFAGFDGSALRNDGVACCIGYYAHPNPEPQPKWFMHPGTQIPAFPLHIDGVIQYHPVPPRPVLRIAEIFGWSGREQVRRLTIDQVVDQVSARLHAWGITTLFSDDFESTALGGLFSQRRIHLHPYHWSEASKADAIGGSLRRLVRDEAMSLVPHSEMERQLLSIREIPKAGQTKWSYPTNGLDFASSLIAMLHGLNDEQIVGRAPVIGGRIFGAPHAPLASGRHVGGSRT